MHCHCQRTGLRPAGVCTAEAGISGTPRWGGSKGETRAHLILGCSVPSWSPASSAPIFAQSGAEPGELKGEERGEPPAGNVARAFSVDAAHTERPLVVEYAHGRACPGVHTAQGAPVAPKGELETWGLRDALKQLSSLSVSVARRLQPCAE